MTDQIIAAEVPAVIEPAKSAYAIPDFQADDAAIKALDVKIEHLIGLSLEAGLEKVRELHRARRQELAASHEFFETVAREAAAEVPAATKKFAAGVNRNTPDPVEKRAAPTLFFEDLSTLGRAGRLHKAMLRAETRAAKAARRAREAQIAVEKHDGILMQLLMTREKEWRQHFATDAGRAELMRDERIAPVAAQVKAIRAEREAFEKRLKAGRVTAEELRNREMARERFAFLAGKVEGLYFTGEVNYEHYRYHRLRDRTGRDWLLDWDDDLRDLERFEFNIMPMSDGSYTVERAIWSDRRVGEARQHDPNRPYMEGVDFRLIAALREFLLDLEDPFRN